MTALFLVLTVVALATYVYAIAGFATAVTRRPGVNLIGWAFLLYGTALAAVTFIGLAVTA